MGVFRVHFGGYLKRVIKRDLDRDLFNSIELDTEVEGLVKKLHMYNFKGLN